MTDPPIARLFEAYEARRPDAGRDDLRRVGLAFAQALASVASGGPAEAEIDREEPQGAGSVTSDVPGGPGRGRGSIGRR